MSVANSEVHTIERPPRAETPLTLVDFYLGQQQELSAVDQFAERHSAGDVPALARHYHALLPAAPPGPGEQYAFDVDLDECSGCKSCVAACHSLNGLDEDETWRDVGLLHGGSALQPFVQHVTTACHHCLDPACLNGCPVRAYEKDARTGIVRHLDDQCIGCQYCIFACPYDVPKYSRKRGIVRKCDMCTHRLEADEAPACVQACPNSAIRITVVSHDEAAQNCQTGVFLPGAPDPRFTHPTTNYRTKRVLPRNALPADYFSARPEHAHWPLILMLVLTQLSVGAFVVEAILARGLSSGIVAQSRPVLAAGALAFGLVALASSALHLGRPLYAFRAIIGLRTSWLSREILAFGLFAALALAYTAVLWQPNLEFHELDAALGAGVALSGLAGVFCSVMIYQFTRRPLWNGAATAVRFVGTTAILGPATTLAGLLFSAGWSGRFPVAGVLVDSGYALAWATLLAASFKLLFEATVFLHLNDRLHTPLKRSALLMKGDLSGVTLARFVLGVVGGIVLPALLLRMHAATISWGTGMLLSCAMLVATLAGELFERYLFFTAVAAPRMPGNLQ